MPSSAWIALLLGTAAFGRLLLYLIRHAGDLEPDEQPQGWTTTQDAVYWSQQASAAREDFGLKALRDVAKAWAASIAGLLGILSAVAVVAGPDALVDVGGTEADIAAWLILAAAGVAAVAVTLAIIAEQGVPQWEADLSGWVYKSLTRKRAKQAADYIQASRYLVIAALLLLVLATGISWLAALTGGENGGQSAIVAKQSGATCGTLTNHGGVLALEVGGKIQPISEGADITPVDSCP